MEKKTKKGKDYKKGWIFWFRINPDYNMEHTKQNSEIYSVKGFIFLSFIFLALYTHIYSYFCKPKFIQNYLHINHLKIFILTAIKMCVGKRVFHIFVLCVYIISTYKMLIILYTISHIVYELLWNSIIFFFLTFSICVWIYKNSL